MNNIDLNLLRVFDALWRHRHLGRASEELEVSQPALSHSLKRMREQIGDSLFVKVHNGMQPSSRALQLAPIVQSILASVREHLLAGPAFDPRTTRRTFTIAMTDIGEMMFLPKLLRLLSDEAPAVAIQSISLPPHNLVTALQRGEVDLTMGYFPDLHGSDIFQQLLFRNGFVCLVRAGHPRARGRLTQPQFRELPHAVVHTEGRSQEIVEQYLKRHRIRRREQLRLPHFLCIPMVLAATDIVVTVPEPIGAMFAQLADIQLLPPPYPFPEFDIKQHWHRCQHDDPGNRWLRKVTRELFGA